MTKTLSMVSCKHYNLSACEGFVMFFTSKLIACFIDGFTLNMKMQSFAYLLNVSEHIHRILDLEDEVHSMWVIWTSGLQECNGNFIFGSQIYFEGNNFRSKLENFRFVLWGLPRSAGS